MVPMATGSDGGGSIRIPAAMCGLTGFKPSLGRVPSGGAQPPGWLDFSTRGVMTRLVRDAVPGLDVAVAPDPSDLRSLPAPEARWSRGLDDIGAPHRVAWSPTLGYAAVDREVAIGGAPSAVEVLAGAGSEVEDGAGSCSNEVAGWSSVHRRRAPAKRTHPSVVSRETEALGGQVDPGLRRDRRSGREPLRAGRRRVRALDDCHRLTHAAW
jgi:Asp-tRNA(Asn)/Glu-tRNA(Gln) amidotransferase A subunit family amidase